MSVRRLLLQRFIDGDHDVLHHPVGAQTVGVVQGDVAGPHQPGPLAQVAHLRHVVGDAVDLILVAVGSATRAERPI